MLPVDIAKTFRIIFLYNSSTGCFWQSYPSTVKSAGMPVLWFPASTRFQFWSKYFMKHCTNNSLLSRDKTISSLLEVIGHAFDFRMFWKNTNCFQFWWKTYTKHYTSNCVISCVKRLSSPSLCSRSDAFNFRVWLGKQNMAMKIPILILLYFCLLCWPFFFVVNWDSLHARLNSHYEVWSYKKRGTKKITGYRKSV